MSSELDETFYIFDFPDELRLFRENPNFHLNNSQYEDLLYFIMQVMQLEIRETLACITSWGIDREKLSPNFLAKSEHELEEIRKGMFEITILLWNRFNRKNMFDINNKGESTFPFVLKDVFCNNLILIKDNYLSSNEVNING